MRQETWDSGWSCEALQVSQLRTKSDGMGNVHAAHQPIAKEQALADAKKQLTASLQHELDIRGLKQKGEMTFEVASLTIEKNYGMVLAALGFVNFIYADPFPLKAMGE